MGREIMNTKSRILLAVGLASLIFVGGCGSDSDTNDSTKPDGPEITTPENYEFNSRADDSVSSVSYSGQTFRHVLIQDLKGYIGQITDQIDQGTLVPEEGEVVETLDFYYRFDSQTAGSQQLGISVDPGLEQETYDDISSDKDLVGKTAGNDSVTDHKDFTTEFAGWSDDSIAANGGTITSPEGLVGAFFGTIEAQAIARANGQQATAPDGSDLPVYVTESGLDLQQLVAKFLLVSVAFHQAADDYLDDDTAGKGLLADNVIGEADYTALEHQWDEGFGYFGAARNYNEYTDDEIAGADGRDDWANGYHDADGDGAIDLKSEYNFGASVNAAKRDRGANVETNFSEDAFNAFIDGRTLIANAGDELTDEEFEELQVYRDVALSSWEKAYAATVVHYINDTLQDMGKFGSEEYSFTDHAKHWSEMKGFALGFQFNPKSPVTEAQFTELHQLMGDAPVLEAAGEEAVDGYRADLVAARDILEQAFEFDPANVGDDKGMGGW